ncbi:Transmembrane protein [Paragonimus heterotremus]|uniref:Transmembrane protein n=1 Tax=Paragonimus heterotremus TaxID=100268 RepID=A0A8J4ST00_9TREM|nr:Transmembrane protein [Paragonimus heterotremus]
MEGAIAYGSCLMPDIPDTTAFVLTGIFFTPLEVLYTLLFCLFVFCTVYPPLEFVAAGVTLENIFGPLLGSENLFFFEYHIRRTTMLRVVWSFYILLCYFMMRCLSETVVLASPNVHPPFTLWDIVLWIGIACATCICSHTYLVWYAGGKWSGHPTIISLRKLANSTFENNRTENSFEERWHSFVSNINAECRRPANFVASHAGLTSSWPGRRLIVTDSWILLSHFTKFQIVRQSADQLIAVLVSTSSVLDTGSLTEGGRPAGESLGTQVMVTVRLADVNTGACLLTFSLPASNLDALRAKLQCPLICAAGVQLEPTIVQRFIGAFSEVVEENGTCAAALDLEIDQCIGCMNQPANVILQKRCDPEAQAALDAAIGITLPYVPPCGTCHCRPMWCMECMARWFASRQTEAHRPPSVWLSGRVPCPTCRAIFCARDVTRLEWGSPPNAS